MKKLIKDLKQAFKEYGQRNKKEIEHFNISLHPFEITVECMTPPLTPKIKGLRR